ncbi:outer membrane lipoprotein carrier protein LolA [Methylobacterium sp. 4-46]|uniref:outer-membrane lipoprotein carrier protein LolA n=1 Tax=unclassified Methylobacterium TaxID=2615210 RepID=UPI000152C344|nr:MULTISPECIES: outer-membrane lipoprotein carrier protein LolA [Methylobacterium]ACA19238.1 outer membrane lipoprotein carrier protein LolA [Methylobacterium sp. 4-46]WFT78445.1 outer-membrane lipoprotein carrier protein LolA [Methylobacterium nodulans]
MTGRPRSGPLALLAALLCLAGAAPAQAQVTSFLDSLFGTKRDQGPQAQPDPAQAAPSGAPGAAGGAPTLSRAPLPPRRPTALGGAKAPVEGGETVAVPAAAPAPAAPPQQVAAVTTPAAVDLSNPAAVVERANGYFNSVSTLTGNFVQIAADGRKIGGKLYLAKPGRLRFDYDQPSPLEVVADGTSVAVRDRKLATQDLYFISQTPLKFLLRDRIDLARDLSVTDVSTEPGGVRISLEDRSTLGGTSRIVLVFDEAMKSLSQWRITDPQGYQTTVLLSNLQRGRPIDGMMFVINYGRPEDKELEQRMRQTQQR